jgi:hypothetical protein
VKPGAYVAAALAVVALAIAAVALAASAHGQAAGSTLSRASGGWMAARRYLEARGCAVTLVDGPDFAGRGVLVVVFPWQRPEPTRAGWMVERHLARGGTVLFAYSGRPSWAEPEVATALGMGQEASVERPPLHPLRWREWEAAASDLVPDAAAGLAPLRVAAPRGHPTPPAGASVLFRDARGRPAVFAFRRSAGRVIVVPAAAFDNAGIEEGGNAGLLESLARTLGTEWAFDEYHHGLAAAPAGGESAGVGRAVDVFLLQLALVYALAVLAVSRRFGPPWREPPVVAGSTGSFLRGVGSLHHRLGHHAVAAGLLVARARQLQPRLDLPDVAPWDRDAEGFLRLAQEIGRTQSGEEKP